MSHPSYGAVRRKLPLWGAVGRFMLPCFLIFGTYNPSNYSLTTLIVNDVTNLPTRVFLGFSLFLAWIVVLRIAYAGLDWTAWFAVVSFIIIMGLLELEFGLIHELDVFTKILLLEMLIANMLGFGLVVSYWTREITGQSPVVKHPP